MRKAGLAFSVLLTILAAPGCGKQAVIGVSGPERPAIRSRVSDSGSKGLPDSYRSAVQLYARKDYRGALAIIDQLLATPNLSLEKREFLRRQRNICLNTQSAAASQSPPRSVQRSGGVADCGPRAMGILLHKIGKDVPTVELARTAGTNRYGTTLAGLEKAAKAKGLKCEAVQMDLNALKQLPGMGIAWVDGDHYVAVLTVFGEEARIHDPNHENEETIPTETLLRRSGGIVLSISQP
jgi:hypothetical protein